jgi:electron-transferring-flavoprotein dehydrogenase
MIFCSAGIEPVKYEERLKESWLWKELWSTRNIRPSFNTSLGMYGGVLYTGCVWYFTRGYEPWTFKMHDGGTGLS